MNSPDSMQRISAIPRHWAEHTPEAAGFVGARSRDFVPASSCTRSWRQRSSACARREAGRSRHDRRRELRRRDRVVLRGDRAQCMADDRQCAHERSRDRRHPHALRAASATVYLGRFAGGSRACATCRCRSSWMSNCFPGVTITRTDESTRAEPRCARQRSGDASVHLGHDRHAEGRDADPSRTAAFLSECRRPRVRWARRIASTPCCRSSHIFGIATITLATLFAGASLCVESRFDPATRSCRAHRASHHHAAGRAA